MKIQQKILVRGKQTVQKCSPNQILSNPISVSQKRPRGATLKIFRLDVTNLQILQVGDIQGKSTNSIMSFHQVDTNLANLLSQHQQI